MPLTRNDVPESRKWDLTPFFKNEAEYEELFLNIKNYIPDIAKYEKKLNISNAIDCLNLNSELSRKLEKLYVYASLKSDEDTANAKYQAMVESIKMLYVQISSATSFIMPELAKLPLSDLKKALSMPIYSNFSELFKAIIREKKHILSAKEEKLLSEVSSFSGDFSSIFNMFDNADIKFDSIRDEKGNKIEMFHGMYSMLLQNPSQAIRAKAFATYYKSYTDMINTIASTYAGSVKKDCAVAKIRGYKSALDSALSSEQISRNVYNNLISAVKKATPAVHQYVALRKKALGLKKLHMYDMYVPLTKDCKLELSYEEAFKLVVESLKPLGREYESLLHEAYNSRWIDVEETKNKRSGAYSSGCYDSYPYVLLNYQPTTHDIFTIAHELGHSIHSYLSKKNQCYEKADYEIFVAEVASTVNEVLMIKHLLQSATGDMRKFLLSYYLDMFRTTLFRQTMFAEFEKFSHESIEQGQPLTAEAMNVKYYELNREYYGKSVVHDKQIASEWARIPHFYRAFYVYKYATGITSAINIANNILKDSAYVAKYFAFLSAGGSMAPLEILKLADIDLEKTTPFDNAMKEFQDVLAELNGLM